MIIKEITLENFRSYYGRNTIKFNDGLMLFIGDNGDGKTTFFEALEWLFDTTKQNIDNRLIAEKKISELPDFSSDTVKVSMTFEHDGEKIVEKSFSFQKENNQIKTSNFQFKGWYIEGVERTQIQGGTLLDRCFEAAIRKYCLFKGEKNLNVFNNSDALKYLIDTFSNIRQFDPYFIGDNENLGFTEFAEKESNKAYEKAMKSDKSNETQEKILSSQLTKLRNNLQDVRTRLKNNRANATNYSTKLDDLESSKEACEQLKQINERLKSLNEKKTKTESFVNEDYTIKLLDEMWILCGFSDIFSKFQTKISEASKAKRKLENEAIKEKGKQEAIVELAKGIIPLPPYIPDAKTMEEMLNDEFCKVCGREAKKDSEAYKFMMRKLDELIKSQQPKEETDEQLLFPNKFIDELNKRSLQLEGNQENINNLSNTIRERIDFNEARKAEVKKIQTNIDVEEDNKRKLLAQNDDLTEDELKNSYQNITNWYKSKSEAEKQIVILEKEEKEVESQLAEVQRSYDELGKTSTANTYRKIHTTFEKIQNAFKYAKEKNTKEFLALLEAKANEYLAKLNIDDFTGIIRIYEDKIERKLKIKLEDKNGTFIASPNQALETTMYMSVLFAVSELTSIKRENDYPLIFDAPTSSFAPQKESDFFNVISDIKKQCIIFTKSFLNDEGKLLDDKIDKLHCTINRMEKQRPFDKDDLSTVQTKITLIK
ncbi:MAG: AAA family ATPase [Prevotellaceae bacterium]|jgi:DNA sulfur modification protein DndD|nr:AAA family ATPase [Prevotellaceae bacterium]